MVTIGCTGVLRLYLAPLVARVPLRMTEVRNPRPHEMLSRTRRVRDRLRCRIAVALKTRGADSSPTVRNSMLFGSAARITLQRSLPFDPVILRDARVNARESKDPEGADCNHVASGSSTETFVENALMQQCGRHSPGSFDFTSLLRREVPLRMTDINRDR